MESVGTEGDYTDFRLSPDNKLLAATLVDLKSGNPQIWLTDLARGGTSPFTLGHAFNASPVWSPDGSMLVFRTTRSGVTEFYQKSAALGGAEQSVMSAAAQRMVGALAVSSVPTDWSRDGRYLIFSTGGVYAPDIWLLPGPGVSPNTEVSPRKFLPSAGQAYFSPNGELVAYSSNEGGGYQVYVQTFPLSDRKWPISTAGGYEPQWRADGREMYFLSEDRKLMAVEVRPGPSFGVPKPLFQTRVPPDVDWLRTHYMPSRDGRRFLIYTQTRDTVPSALTVVLNWTSLLKK
jgi:Tol biopolymer transport system component